MDKKNEIVREACEKMLAYLKTLLEKNNNNLSWTPEKDTDDENTYFGQGDCPIYIYTPEGALDITYGRCLSKLYLKDGKVFATTFDVDPSTGWCWDIEDDNTPVENEESVPEECLPNDLGWLMFLCEITETTKK